MLSTKTLFTPAGYTDLDDRTLEFLTQAIEKGNLPGFDYVEFKRAVSVLMSMQLDEATAHKSAFATAATVGLTKEKLVETAGFYRNLLEKERDQFAQALENQRKSKVAARESENARLRDQIARHKADIARMQEELGQYQQQLEQNETSIKSEAGRLEKSQTAFEYTHKALVLQIEKDVEAMHKHL